MKTPPVVGPNRRKLYQERIHKALHLLRDSLPHMDRKALEDFAFCVNPQTAVLPHARTFLPACRLYDLQRSQDKRAAMFGIILQLVEAYWTLCNTDESPDLERLTLTIEKIATTLGQWTVFDLVSVVAGFYKLEVPLEQPAPAASDSTPASASVAQAPAVPVCASEGEQPAGDSPVHRGPGAGNKVVR